MKKYNFNSNQILSISSLGALLVLVLQVQFFWIPNILLSQKLIFEEPKKFNPTVQYSILNSNDSLFWNQISKKRQSIQIIKLDPGITDARKNGIQIERQSILLEGDFFDLLDFQYSIDTNSKSLRVGRVELSKTENKKIQYLMELLSTDNEIL